MCLFVLLDWVDTSSAYTGLQRPYQAVDPYGLQRSPIICTFAPYGSCFTDHCSFFIIHALLL